MLRTRPLGREDVLKSPGWYTDFAGALPSPLVSGEQGRLA